MNTDLINAQIATLQAKISQIDTDLSNHMNNSSKILNQQLQSAELQRIQLSAAISHSNNLISLLSSSNSLSSQISFTFNSLDSKFVKTQKTKNYITDIQTLKNNIQKIHFALEKKDYIEASKSINIIRKLPPSILEGSFTKLKVPTEEIPTDSKTLISNWISDLTSIFTTNFSRYSTEKNFVKLTETFSLFPLIGQDEVGLNNYAKFICNIISNQNRVLLTQSTDSTFTTDKPYIYSTLIHKFLETITQIMQNHTPIITKYYGRDAMSYVYRRIQAEIDVQAGIIVDTFIEVRILPILSKIDGYSFEKLEMSTSGSANSQVQYQNDRAYGQQSNESGDNKFDEEVGVIEVNELISEFWNIIESWDFFCDYVGRMFEFTITDKSKITVSSTTEDKEKQIQSNYQYKIVSNYIHKFEKLILFNFKKSLEKSIVIESLPDFLFTKLVGNQGDTLISSVVEDFIIITNSFLPKLAKLLSFKFLQSDSPTRNEKLLTDIGKNLNFILNYLALKLFENQPRANSSLVQLIQYNATNTASQLPSQQSSINIFRGASQNDLSKMFNYIVYLNSLDLVHQYLTTQASNSTAHSQSLTKLLTHLTKVAVSIKTKSIKQLYIQSIQSKVVTSISELLNDSYIIQPASSTNLANGAASGASLMAGQMAMEVEAFDKKMKETFDPISIVLSTSNIIETKGVAIQDVVGILEGYLLGKSYGSVNGSDLKINSTGMPKFDRYVSSVVHFFSFDDYLYRLKFRKVLTILKYLNFEFDFDEGEDDEELQAEMENELEKVLSVGERLKVMKIKVDR